MAKSKKSQATKIQALIDSCDTGDVMAAQPDLRHMKLQGFSGGGKSHFGLTFVAHKAKEMGLLDKPEQVLVSILDCDLEGVRALIKRDDIIPPEIKSRIYRKVCETPEMVNQMTDAFIQQHKAHQAEFPDGLRVLILENEAAFYVGCRDFYSLEVHGVSEADLMLARQAQAISEGKKTLPAFAEGQMHSYKVINKLFYTPYQKLKMAAEALNCHFISTVLLREYTEGYGTSNEKKVVTASGRADMTDPLFDWIIEFGRQQRVNKKSGNMETRHIATIRKSRDCEPFQLHNWTQEKFWKAVADN